MKPYEFTWDGKHLPDQLKDLPPGRYAIEPVDEANPLTKQEEAGIMAALNSLDSGKGIPLSDLIREIRNHSR